MRILIGTFDICGIGGDFAAAFRALGHDVTLALAWADPWMRHRRSRLNCGADLRCVSWPALGRRLRANGPKPPRRFAECHDPLDRVAWLIDRHDLFIFVHASLRPGASRYLPRWGAGREYPLLKRLGKRIVAVFTGPDVRHRSAFDQQCASLGFQASPMSGLMPAWGRTRLSTVLGNLRRSELHADLILSQPNQSGLAIRPYNHFFVPIDRALYRHRVPAREAPVVLHAPSNPGIKGTSLILESLARLRSAGVAFELRHREGLTNARLRQEMTDADILIDQVHLPMHGKQSLEGMASGCAVASCDRSELEPYPTRRPLWHVEPHGLDRRLRRLITDRDLRIRLASAGGDYVSTHHDHLAVSEQVLRALDDPRALHMHRPDFFARRYELPTGIKIPQALLTISARIAGRFGLPRGALWRDMSRRGLLPGCPSRLPDKPRRDRS